MSDHLVVWINDSIAGVLRPSDTRRSADTQLVFEPDPGARALTASSNGRLSPWNRTFAKNWFDGLLPDDRQRTAAEINYGIARGDTFGLLEAIGWECAGAISVLPEGQRPETGAYRHLSSDEMWERLDALPLLIRIDDLDDEENAPRSSLGGAQEKMLLRRSPGGVGDGWDLPLRGAPSTHIFKPEPAGFDGLATAEAYCLLAASVVTESAEAEVLAEPGHRPVLIVTRFDRTTGPDGSIRRIHQEDGCQVLGLPPEQKYAASAKAEPLHAQLARVLLTRSVDPVRELRRLLTQVTVNLAVGNADAHAKNYSFRHQGGDVTLAPMYDVCPTRAFRLSDNRASMPIAGRFRIDEITRGCLRDEAGAWGIPAREAEETIRDTLDRLAEGITIASQRYPDVADKVRSSVEIHHERLSTSAW